MTVFIIWVICAVIAGGIGSGKGRKGMGWLLGILLGPLGLLIIAVMPADAEKTEEVAIMNGEERKCPFCAELIKSEAIVCKHCGRDVPRVEPGKDASITAEQPAPTMDAQG